MFYNTFNLIRINDNTLVLQPILNIKGILKG